MNDGNKELNVKSLGFSDVMNRLNDLETKMDANFHYLRKDIASLDNTVQTIGCFICDPSRMDD